MLKFLILLFCSETIQFIVFCYTVQMHRIIGSDFNDAIFCLYKLHLLNFSKLYQINLWSYKMFKQSHDSYCPSSPKRWIYVTNNIFNWFEGLFLDIPRMKNNKSFSAELILKLFKLRSKYFLSESIMNLRCAFFLMNILWYSLWESPKHTTDIRLTCAHL